MTTRGTSYRETTDWREDADCRGDYEAFDLDVIRGDPDAIRAALDRCHACPVLDQCDEFTEGLPRKDRPQELIQAGRVWSKPDWRKR